MDEVKEFILEQLDQATDRYLNATVDVVPVVTINSDGAPIAHYLLDDSGDKKQKFVEMNQCLDDAIRYSESLNQ